MIIKYLTSQMIKDRIYAVYGQCHVHPHIIDVVDGKMYSPVNNLLAPVYFHIVDTLYEEFLIHEHRTI